MTVEDRFVGKAAWFDEHYETVRGRVRLELVLERLRGVLPPPPARILDAGGGTGAFAIPLARIGHQVTLLDQSGRAPKFTSSLARRQVTTDQGPARRWWVSLS